MRLLKWSSYHQNRFLQNYGRTDARSLADEFYFTGFDDHNTPCYAILSHTWGGDRDEVLYEDIIAGTKSDSPVRSKAGYAKLPILRETGCEKWLDVLLDRHLLHQKNLASQSFPKQYGLCFVGIVERPDVTCTSRMLQQGIVALATTPRLIFGRVDGLLEDGQSRSF